MDTDLTPLFNPRSVAIVGASDKPDSLGQRVVANLIEHSQFDGDVFLVSTTKKELYGRACYPDVPSLPKAPDVAVVVVPANAAMAVLVQCADRGVKFAVVLTSGFGEAGEGGLALEAEMRSIVARSGMRIYGPNCPGICNINARIGLTFSPSFRHDLQRGPIGVATQGGGLGRNILQAMDRGIGVGLWASSGNEADLQVADFIRYMADAPDIQVIITLIEGIKDGRRFVEAVQAAARAGKPVVALKVGRSAYGQRAARSHTASITGSSDVNSAVFRQLGVIEVDDIDELVDTAWLLARQTPTGARDIAIYCSSGGAASLTADAVGQAGVGLATFQPATLDVLRSQLPAYAGMNNPVDTTTVVLTDSRIADATLKAVCLDPGVSLVLFPVTLQYDKVTEQMADSCTRVQRSSPVPIVPIWMTDRTGPGFAKYAEAGMLPARSVGKAVKAVRRWIEHGVWRQRPERLDWQPLPTLGKPRGAGMPLSLSESQAKAMLRDAGITLPESVVATSRDGAVAAASRIGLPVVAKIASAQITHKTEVGGVAIGLADGDAVAAAWDRIHASVAAKAPEATIDGILIEKMAAPGGVECFIGVSCDPTFGHVLTFGLGGIYVEVFKDVSRRLLPLLPHEADSMIREIKSWPLLDGARGRPKADIAALKALLLQVSDFVVAHADHVDEVDLNPVWVGPVGQGAVPLDAVIVGTRKS